jgi:hypothetical protein
MKKIYTLIAAVTLIASTASAQQIWDNFEDVRQTNYGFINGVFIPYFTNPYQSGANTSQVAAQYIRNSAETFDVILLQRVMANLTDYLTGEKTITMDVWSPNAGVTVQVTLENTALAMDPYPAGRHSEYQATTTLAGQWQTLTFSLTGTPDPSVAPTICNQFVLLFAPNTNTGDTYYFDNVSGPEFATDACADAETDASILNDFQCQQNVNFIFSHSGINFQRRVNPDQTGNTSSHVASYVRNGAEENDVIIGRFPNGNLSLGTSGLLTLDVWDSNAPTDVTLSLQTTEGAIILAMTASTSTSSAWQTLSFDASEVSGSTDIGQFVILFDPGASSADQYYFDNFEADIMSSVEDLESVLSFSAYPNPSQGQTNFMFDLRETASVNFTVTDITGKVVEQINLGQRAAGVNQFVWNAQSFASGLYFYTFNVGGQAASGKLFLNR